MKIAHIINPVKVGPASDLFIAQPVTFETLRQAQQQASSSIEVELLATSYEEDAEVHPEGFRKLPNLERSVLDFGTFQPQKKLPILADILDRAFEGSDADYLIYTNVDISVLPHFYQSVARLLERHDGLVINRRTIDDEHTEVSDIPLMWSKLGGNHGGFDCFVFERAAYQSFELAASCIGVKGIGIAAMANLLAFSNRFRLLRRSHMTFHIGNDMTWNSSKLDGYAKHNFREINEAMIALRDKTGPLDMTTAHGRFLIDRYHKGHHYYLEECLKLDNSDRFLAPRKNRDRPKLRSMLGKLKRRLLLYSP